MDPADVADWDRALAWALTGIDHPAWSKETAPDLDRLTERLHAAGIDPGVLRGEAQARRRAGEAWPIPVPDHLRQGIGAAQFSALIREATDRYLFDPPGRDSASSAASTPDGTEASTTASRTASNRPVLSSRAPDADELRLLRDVPPHYGV